MRNGWMQHRFRLAALLGVMALCGMAAAGCGGGNSGTSTGRSASVLLPDNLTLTLTVDRSQQVVGSGVVYRIDLTNKTAAAITSTYAGFNGGGSTIYSPIWRNIEVKNRAGVVVGTDGNPWTPPPLRFPDRVMVTLQPGETLSLSLTYTFIQADVYTARVNLINPDVTSTAQTGPVSVLIL